MWNVVYHQVHMTYNKEVWRISLPLQSVNYGSDNLTLETIDLNGNIMAQ